MSQLSQLVSLIANATKLVETHANATNTDLSLDSLEPPSDTFYTPVVEEAIRIIEGACNQLCAIVANPSHTVVNKAFAHFEPACIRVVASLRIPDLLFDKPQGLHASDIVKHVSSQQGIAVDQGKLARVMRLLATKHCFREVENDVFANNRLSIQLLSYAGLADSALHITDELAKAASVLTETLTDSEMGLSYSPNKTPFNKSTGYPGTIFEYYEGLNTETGRVQGLRFHRSMPGWSRAVGATCVATRYPWEKLPPGSVINDVGGGIGVIAMQLYKVHPHLQYVLQDRPPVIATAELEYWPSHAPEAIRDSKIQFKAVDFFSEPLVRGCDVYYMKGVIHDWADEDALKILSNVKAVMKPTSRILVHDYVLQHTTRKNVNSVLKIAPEPLLPNYGAGRIKVYNLDLNMMCVMNSLERYQEDFASLGEKAGLKILQIYECGDANLVEYVLQAAVPFTNGGGV